MNHIDGATSANLPAELAAQLERIGREEFGDFSAYLREVTETAVFPSDEAYQTFVFLAWQKFAAKSAQPIANWDAIKRDLAAQFPGRFKSQQD